MLIRFVDLKKNASPIASRIEHEIKKIIESGDYVLGKQVRQFEKKFATYLGSSYCIGVSSGTDALHLALIASNIEAGDEVIVPAMSFIATVSPIIILGAKPVFVDISPNTNLIDVTKIEQAINNSTKAIVAVHLYGSVCDMDAIKKIATKHKLTLIEDACQAHGSTYQNKKAGTFGDVSVFSFYPSKNLGAFGEAGAVVASNKDIAQRVSILRDHGQTDKYIHHVIGYNNRLDTIQAAVLNVKLDYLDRWNKKRIKNAQIYNKLLKDLPVSLPLQAKEVNSNFHLYVIKTKKRNQLAEFLKKKKIFCGKHYPIPLHLQPSLKFLNYKKGDFPHAEQLAKECLSLPMYPGLTQQELKYISFQIHSFFK